MFRNFVFDDQRVYFTSFSIAPLSRFLSIDTKFRALSFLFKIYSALARALHEIKVIQSDLTNTRSEAMERRIDFTKEHLYIVILYIVFFNISHSLYK